MNELLNVHDIGRELGISRSSAYKVIHNLNQELQDRGYLVVNGKVPRKYFMTRYYLSECKES